MVSTIQIFILLLSSGWGASVATGEVTFGASIVPICLIGILLTTFYGKTNDNSGPIGICIFVLFIVGSLADDVKTYDQLLQEIRADFLALKKEWIEMLKEKNENIKSDDPVVKTIGADDDFDEEEEMKVITGNCALSVMFEVENCPLSKVQKYRKIVDKCDKNKLTSSDYKEIEMMVSGIDMSSSSSKYSTSLVFLKQLLSSMLNEDKVSICRVKDKIDYLKRNKPDQFVFMKYIMNGQADEFSKLNEIYQSGKTTARVMNWASNPSYGRGSFKRVMISAIITVVVAIVSPLMLNKQAMRHYQLILIGTIIIGALIVMF